MTTLDAALDALSWNIFPVPVPHGEKAPVLKGWEKLRLSADDLQEHFSNGNNVGWLLGVAPRRIADVDIDCDEALRVAPLIEGPPTARVFGRASCRSSHHLFELPEEFSSNKFTDPIGKRKDRTLIELRGAGAQSVMPPSLHGESGEVREWEKCGDFGLADYDTLHSWVSKIASAALFVRYWPGNYETPQAIAGMLARAGWAEEDTGEFVTAIIAVVKDGDREEIAKARREVRGCYERLERDLEICGRTKLIERYGEDGKKIVTAITGWLGIKRDRTRAVAAGKIIASERGDTLPLLANAITTIRKAWATSVALNEFSLFVEVRCPLPWLKKAGTNWSDTDDLNCADWLQHEGVYCNSGIAAAAVQVIAEENKFHPVRDYLGGLTWDGTPRTTTWLHDYLGVARGVFADAVASRWLVSGVARILRPGCRADCCLTLEGRQGRKKSTALAALAGEEWYTDHLGNLDNKDAQLVLHGVWIVELGELSALKNSQVSRVKTFLSTTSDFFRPPYGRRCERFPRSNIFAGSTNDEKYLEDPTGARRFWPVACTGTSDDKALARDRDQLWAEAHKLYLDGAVWWLENAKLDRIAERAQDLRYETGVWDERIERWLENLPVERPELSDMESVQGKVTVTDILTSAVGKRIEDCRQSDKNAVSRFLTHAGWMCRLEWVLGKDGKKTARRFYRPRGRK